MSSFFPLTRQNKAITLAELIISITLLGFLSIGVWSIDRFIHLQLINADYRARLQKEASYIMDHIAKMVTGAGDLGGAIGDIDNPPIELIWPATSGRLVKIYIDRNANGIRDTPAEGDVWIAYRHFLWTPGYHGQLWFYPRCEGAECETSTIAPACLSYKVREFNICNSSGYLSGSEYDPTKNYLPVYIRLCWFPGEAPHRCGELENPEVEMTVNIEMPGVSTH